MTTTHERQSEPLIRDDVIATGLQVVLRRKRVDDAPADYGWRRDEALARYDAARPIAQLYEDFLRNFREELVTPHPFRRTFAVETPDGHHIGNVMYYNIDLARHETELGVTIGDPDYWGHGLGTEAVRLLVDYVFSTTSLNRIYLHTLDWNLRAQRAFHNAGFRDTGRSRRGSHRFHRMEITRPAG
jgi:RimJ/RimL family protein N-acetyltransferase